MPLSFHHIFSKLISRKLLNTLSFSTRSYEFCTTKLFHIWKHHFECALTDFILTVMHFLFVQLSLGYRCWECIFSFIISVFSFKYWPEVLLKLVRFFAWSATKHTILVFNFVCPAAKQFSFVWLLSFHSTQIVWLMHGIKCLYIRFLLFCASLYARQFKTVAWSDYPVMDALFFVVLSHLLVDGNYSGRRRKVGHSFHSFSTFANVCFNFFLSFYQYRTTDQPLVRRADLSLNTSVLSIGQFVGTWTKNGPFIVIGQKFSCYHAI